MRLSYCLTILILLSFSAEASWLTYQNDLKNTGQSDGTGYFPLQTANFTDESNGMDFQPLTGDLDGNGNKEIVIFSNDSLIVYNPQLEIVKQAKVGAILGQPELFNFDDDIQIEIIFNSGSDSEGYFHAYQFSNSELSEEFEIQLEGYANFSGVKCLEIDSSPFCIFKDRSNYIHVIDMAARTDSPSFTSGYNATAYSVPAIGDIDDDGSQDAVFWHDQNGNMIYGLIAFDIVNRSIKWHVDDIFEPAAIIPISYFVMEGQPVLVDLNNDNKLETAVSIFYNDKLHPGYDIYDDWFTQLFVYSHNGTELFSRCEVLGQVGCNDGDSMSEKWEGSDPFVLDYDKNGVEDICFIKDFKNGPGFPIFGFSYMGLSCYNYSGDLIANVKLSAADTGIRSTAMTADMNNDGDKEIILADHIYMQNGSSIFYAPLEKFHPVAADLDGNSGLDLVWTKGNTTMVFLDNYNYSMDLGVSGSDIAFSRIDDANVNVTALIRNTGQAEAVNVKAAIYNANTLENRTFLVSVKKGRSAAVSSVIGMKEGQKAIISADIDNEINESNENNNFAFREFIRLPYVYVLSDVSPPILNQEFADYIRNRLTSGYYTTKENEADVRVYIGKNNPFNQLNNNEALARFGFGYDFGNIIFNDMIGSSPYSALVGSFMPESPFGKTPVNVMIAGNGIEGDIAGAKEFIKNHALFLNTKDNDAVFVDDENEDAVRVYDFLHLGGNEEHYGLNNNEFRTIVRNALNDEMFTVEDKKVVTGDGINLRLRNLKPNMSSDYIEYLESSGMPVDMPVVLAHGLFSNLTTWEVLGAELSNIGRDTWLIEITGGPGQDCDDCIDYTFYNLTDSFVPALLNGVLDFTGKDNLQYVGFSNGCRSALDSLERGMFDSDKVETFVAVGCPGAFEGNSTTGNIIKSRNGAISERLESIGRNHYSFGTIAIAALFNRNYIPKGGSNKISLNLWRFYEDIINSGSDTQPGNIQVPNFVIIQGSELDTDDGIVTVKDEQKIYQNVNIINSKKHFDIFVLHSDLDERDRTKSIIKKSLNKQELTFYERVINLINQSG